MQLYSGLYNPDEFFFGSQTHDVSKMCVSKRCGETQFIQKSYFSSGSSRKKRWKARRSRKSYVSYATLSVQDTML